MRGRRGVTLMALALTLFASCIASDEITTITILPDGSADWVRFQSHLRSTEPGEKGAEELRRFVADFDARRDPDFDRIGKAGGEVLSALWVRREEPYSTVLAARFPTAKALERFLRLEDDKGEPVIETCFGQEAHRRRLSVKLRSPQEEPPGAAERPDFAGRLQEEANGLSVTRVAVSGGRITSARGFVVAQDRRSALVDPLAIQDLLHAGGGRAELRLEWELIDG